MHDAKFTNGKENIFREVPAHKSGIFCIKYDRKRHMIVIAEGDGDIKFWDFAGEAKCAAKRLAELTLCEVQIKKRQDENIKPPSSCSPFLTHLSEIGIAEVDFDITINNPIGSKTTMNVSPNAVIKYFVESPGEDNKFLSSNGNGAMFRQSCDGSDEVRQLITRDQLSSQLSLLCCG